MRLRVILVAEGDPPECAVAPTGPRRDSWPGKQAQRLQKRIPRASTGSPRPTGRTANAQHAQATSASSPIRRAVGPWHRASSCSSRVGSGRLEPWITRASRPMAIARSGRSTGGHAASTRSIQTTASGKPAQNHIGNWTTSKRRASPRSPWAHDHSRAARKFASSCKRCARSVVPSCSVRHLAVRRRKWSRCRSRMASASPGSGELLGRVEPDRHEQSVPHTNTALDDDERLVHQPGEHVQAVGLADARRPGGWNAHHRHRGFEVEPTGEHGEPSQAGLLHRVEQAIAPIERGSQGALARWSRPRAGREHAEAVVEASQKLRGIDRSQPRAASSNARGMPSSRRQMAASASALAAVNRKFGSDASARAQSSSIASEVALKVRASLWSGRGNDSGGTTNTTSAGRRSGSRLVVSTVTPGQLVRTPCTRSATAPTTCSQLSSSTSALREARRVRTDPASPRGRHSHAP